MDGDSVTRVKAPLATRPAGNAPIKLPVTLSSHPLHKPRLGLAFTVDDETWTVTAAYWRGVPRYALAHRADGLGEWVEVTEDELVAMLERATS